jgi:hypothetical protein
MLFRCITHLAISTNNSKKKFSIHRRSALPSAPKWPDDPIAADLHTTRPTMVEDAWGLAWFKRRERKLLAAMTYQYRSVVNIVLWHKELKNVSKWRRWTGVVVCAVGSVAVRTCRPRPRHVGLGRPAAALIWLRDGRGSVG